MVGVYGSAEARRATGWAAELAAELRAEVIVIHALPVRDQLAQDIPTLGLAPWRHELEHALTTAWCAPLREANVAHRAILAKRPPACALIGAAAKAQAFPPGDRNTPILTALAEEALSSPP